MALQVIFINYATGEVSEPVPSAAEGWYPAADYRGYTSSIHFAKRRIIVKGR